MKYIYAFVLGTIIVGGLAFVIYMGRSQPTSFVKIPYTQFNGVSEVADAILSGSREDLQGASLVMLGVIPGRALDLEVWKAFLEQNKSPEIQFQVVVIDPDLPGAAELFPDAVKMDIKKDNARFIEGAKNARTQGLRMAVIVPNMYASQRLQENPVARIRENSDLVPLSYSLTAFPRMPEEEAQMETPCVMGPNDRRGTGALGCAIVEAARLEYPKKSKPGTFESLMKLVGDKDYLVLLNPK
ncbi:hypothetical protein [Bdellovibrio sp. HCB337]|uniref:hypothetical protein n=1 Tax=Bdellovibrio sp. HCB337 TaxID=3394358 RepID=UPI0039A44A4E